MRMLFLTDAYLEGHTLDHFRAAVLQAFRDAGADVELVIANRFIDTSSWRFFSEQAEREFHDAVNAERWDVVFNFNRAGMIDSARCVQDHTPTLTWFIDSPERVPETLRKHKQDEHVFIPDDTYLDKLSCRDGLEPRRVHFLPFGSTPDMVRADDLDQALLEKYEADVSFVGTFFPMHPLVGLLAGMNKSTSRRLIALAEDHLANYHVPIAELMQKHDLQLAAVPGAGDSLQGYLLRAIDDYQSSTVRLDCLEALSDMGLRIYGNASWADAALRSLRLADCFEFREARPEELKYIYQASRLSLNICHVQARSGAPIRVFDVVGCGGFLLSERRADLTRLFREDSEVVIFDGSEELREKAEYYLSHSTERQAVAEAGRSKILEQHMVEHRVQAMLEHLR